MSIRHRIQRPWETFWMQLAGTGRLTRHATRLAGIFSPGYKGKRHLAYRSKQGYISPSATVYLPDRQFGEHIFIGEDVTLYQANDGGRFSLGANSSIHKGCIVEIGQRGSLSIGEDSHIQPRCQLSAYAGKLEIGDRVQIAPGCAFYPYNHQVAKDVDIKDQPLTSKGGIRIGDDAWLGYGVVVLDGVHIGRGAVIGATSLVCNDIPDYAIAVGSPAKVIRYRE